MRSANKGGVVLWGVLVLMVAPATAAWPAAGSGDIEGSFMRPPVSARPLTWWDWLDGNITASGITGDLEAMKRIGLGGVYLFDCGMGMPNGPIRFLQPRWLHMMDHTVNEAQRLGLKFGVHNCDGFSQSGGPWITPEKSMKQLTWTAIDVLGPAEFNAVLSRPNSKEGFYRDIAVIAFPRPEGGRVGGPGSDVTLRGTLGKAALNKLNDGDPHTCAVFPVPGDRHVVNCVFPTPRTIRSIVCRGAAPHRWEQDFPIRFEVSDDGTTFRPVGTFTINWDMTSGVGITAAFESATGTVFRLVFRNPWPVRIGEIELSDAARVHFAEPKAGRLRSRGHGAGRRHFDAYPGPPRGRSVDARYVVARDAVCNLTSQMDGAGRLRWQVPAGRWRVLRVGYTSNGHRVSPATAEGRGLECDKLDPRAVDFHLQQYVGRLLDRAGPAAGQTFTAMEVDSWECGIQNWTAGLDRRFQQAHGYNLMPFLPLLLEGWIEENPDVSERVLWDWRRFLADQFSQAYFSQIARFARRRGVTYVGESTGRQQYLYDIGYQRNSAVPMGEFWLNTGPGQGVRVDNKVASSVAHTTGHAIVASEAYTAGPDVARWQNHPFTLKPLGDKAFCAGVNQFVFHTFAHQPYEVTGPGFTFFWWGLNFNRGNSWWDVGRAWLQYLTRCNYLLRQGHSVADVLFFVGEDVPNRIGWRDELRPALPPGYDFDGCDVQALMGAHVDQGRVVLTSGTAYRVLLLPNLATMRPVVLKKIHDLATAGAVIVGRRREQSASLRDLGAGDQMVRSLADALWGPRSPEIVDHAVGRGRVVSGLSFDQVFERLNLAPDFQWHGASPNMEILYVHRHIGPDDVYFVSNQRNRRVPIDAVFRAGARTPELWDPATGAAIQAPVFRTEAGCVHVPLNMDPFGSVFVVFRRPVPARHVTAVAAANEARELPKCVLKQTASGKLMALFFENGAERLIYSKGRCVVIKADDVADAVRIPGPWKVRFPHGLGAPAATTLPELGSWSEQTDPGIRFFSGTATYEKELDVPPALLGPSQELYLELGRVEVIAEVTLNGRDLGILWKPPFRVRIDGAAKPGPNRLEIRVTNLWPNRMIGDAALPEDVPWQTARRKPFPARWPKWLLSAAPRPSGRITFCTRHNVYSKEDALLPSGLLGPVTLRPAVVKAVP